MAACATFLWWTALAAASTYNVYQELSWKQDRWAFAAAEDQLVSVSSSASFSESLQNGSIVHVSGKASFFPTQLEDTQFGLRVSARRLTRVVEHCQWEEQKKESDEASGRTHLAIEVCKGLDGSLGAICLAVAGLIDVVRFVLCAYKYFWPEVSFATAWTSTPDSSSSKYDTVTGKTYVNPAPRLQYQESSWKVDTMHISKYTISDELEQLGAVDNNDLFDQVAMALDILELEHGSSDTEGCSIGDSFCGNFILRDGSGDPVKLTLSPLFHTVIQSAGLRYVQSSDGWFLSSGDLVEESCTAGAVRLRFLIQHAPSWTAVGQLAPSNVLEPIHTSSGKRIGKLRRGIIDAKTSFEDLLHFWRGVGLSRVCGLLLCIILSYRHLRSVHHIQFTTALTLGYCYGVSTFCIYLGCVWSSIYGVQDWRGEETSRVQLLLLFTSIMMLFMIHMSQARLVHGMERGAAIVSEALTRIHSGYFRISRVEDNVSASFVKWFMRLLALALVSATLAAMTAGAVGQKSTSLHHFGLYMLVGSGVCTVCAFGLLVVRRSIVSKTPSLHHEAPASPGHVWCPICLENVREQEALVLAPCGHTVCKACHQETERVRLRKCPTCRVQVHRTVAFP